MKVLQLCGFYPPSIGGIETYVQSLSENLVAQGHSVTVMSRYLIEKKPFANEELRNGVRIIWFKSRKNTPISTAVTWVKILYYARLEEFDVIHTHTVVPIALIGGLLKRWRGKPLVSMIHESQFLFGMKHWIYRKIARGALRKSDFVYASSQELKDVASTLQIGRPVNVLSNAVEVDRFHPDRSNVIRKELKLRESIKIITTTRRFVPKNGVIYLIQAIPHVVAKDDHVHFYIIGDGPERHAIENEITRLGIAQYITLKGAMQNTDMPPYLNAADLYILPSLEESTSMAGLEAMACGLPIVGTRVGGIPEIIADGKNGYLCEPGNPVDLADKILLVLKNPKQLGKESRRIVLARFDWKDRIKDILRVYDGIVKK